jgi:UDP-2,4-diacetamido-2,4,6-trideoxy-beta-L-altropyranose hydrolase
MRIAIRVDASPVMGLGHLQRCLALAAALRETGTESVFVTRDLGVDAADRIARAGHPVHRLPPPGNVVPIETGPPQAPWAQVAWTVDAGQTCDGLAGMAVQWVVVDHYAFDASWHRMVAVRLATRIAVIDDLADRPLDAALLIDQNLHEDHRRKYNGVLAHPTPLLAGPRFALLDAAYAAAQRCKPGQPVRSIGIFMGGTDARYLSASALRACREEAGFEGNIEIVTTRANPRHHELIALAGQWPRTRVSLDLPHLAGFFGAHDVQIGASGGAMWERCCIGAPTLAVVAAENQRTVIDELARLGAVVTPDPIDDTSPNALARALRPLLDDAGLRKRLSATTQTLVDGLGARRVAAWLTAAHLRVRPATPADSVTVHSWRNHPSTRSTSRNAAPIPFDEHARWFERVLTDPDRLLLIGAIGELAVGVVRFDRQGSETCEVSIYLDPAMHGLGIGLALLQAGEAHALAHGRPFVKLLATVLPGNIASNRLFESAGYHFNGDVLEKTAIHPCIPEGNAP